MGYVSSTKLGQETNHKQSNIELNKMTTNYK